MPQVVRLPLLEPAFGCLVSGFWFPPLFFLVGPWGLLIPSVVGCPVTYQSFPGHGLLAPDGKQGLCRADSTAVHTGKGFEMAQRCYSPPGCQCGVGEAAVVALVPGVHPGLRLPDGDPPGAPHVPGQLAHGEHSRGSRTGPGRERREDLNHPDWADPLPPPAVDITDAGPEGREDQIEKKGKHPLRYPQGAHRLDHGQWWNTNLGTHQ